MKIYVTTFYTVRSLQIKDQPFIRDTDTSELEQSDRQAVEFLFNGKQSLDV